MDIRAIARKIIELGIREEPEKTTQRSNYWLVAPRRSYAQPPALDPEIDGIIARAALLTQKKPGRRAL
jgi:hypothetical protein